MKKLSFKILLASTVALFAATSCQNIPVNERLLPVEKTDKTGKRTVLLEDFTGVHCVNCPKAAQAIHEIKALYGDKVVAVALHGAEAFTPKSDPLFSTDAEAYYLRFAPGVGLPAGMVNRKKLAGNNSVVIDGYTTWAGLVKREVELPQILAISQSASPKGEKGLTATVRVKKQAPTLPSKLMLQVWVIEDDIIHIQHGAENQYSYKHKHVLRGAVNGTWGEALELDKEYRFEYTLPRVVEIENCSLVSFVYDGDTMEVLEANVVPLKK